MKFNKLIMTGLFVAASSAYSGDMGPACDKDNLNTPCANTGLNFAGRALYLQPGYGGSPWIGERTVTNTTNNVTQQYGVKPGYSWGFFLEGSYHFSKGKDFNLNWYSLNNKANQSNNLASGGSRTSSITTNWDAVNFEVGKSFKFGDIDLTRIHAGVEYARINAAKPFATQNNVASPIININQAGYAAGNTRSNFNGFGPRVGIDLNYNLPYAWTEGFKAYANGAIAILSGSTKYNRTQLSGNDYQSSNQVVPELDIKLGLNYMHDIARGQLIFDAGWMWYDYISGVVGGALGDGNVSFQGLYFGLKWQGNIA